MEPLITADDTLIVNVRERDPEPLVGRVVVAVSDDQAYVKKLTKRGSRFKLASLDGSMLPGSPERVYRVVQVRRDV